MFLEARSFGVPSNEFRKKGEYLKKRISDYVSIFINAITYQDDRFAGLEDELLARQQALQREHVSVLGRRQFDNTVQ